MSTPTRSAVPVSCADALALLLQHHPEDQALELVQTRVQNKPLALHPTATTTTTTTAAGDGRAGGDARDRRRQERQAKQARPRRKPRPLTAREKRALNVHALPARSQLAYATFVPLHTLWLSYANSLVALGGGAAAMAGRLASGDLHGAVVEVVRSRAVDRVGIRGIVVKETRATLVVVTQADEAKSSSFLPLPRPSPLFSGLVRFGAGLMWSGGIQLYRRNTPFSGSLCPPPPPPQPSRTGTTAAADSGVKWCLSCRAAT